MPQEADPIAGLEVLDLNQLTVKRPLGRGGFAVVYAATYGPQNMPVALKVFQPAEPNSKAQGAAYERMFLREAACAQQHQHENLVKCYGVVQIPEGYKGIRAVTGATWGIVLELAEPYTTRTLITKTMTENRHTYSNLQAYTWLTQIASALAYLHGLQPPVIHRDIKQENILLQRQGAATPAGPAGDGFEHGGGGGGDGSGSGGRGRSSQLVAKLADLGLHVTVEEDRSTLLRRKNTSLNTRSIHSRLSRPYSTGAIAGTAPPSANVTLNDGSTTRVLQKQQQESDNGMKPGRPADPAGEPGGDADGGTDTPFYVLGSSPVGRMTSDGRVQHGDSTFGTTAVAAEPSVRSPPSPQAPAASTQNEAAVPGVGVPLPASVQALRGIALYDIMSGPMVPPLAQGNLDPHQGPDLTFVDSPVTGPGPGADAPMGGGPQGRDDTPSSTCASSRHGCGLASTTSPASTATSDIASVCAAASGHGSSASAASATGMSAAQPADSGRGAIGGSVAHATPIPVPLSSRGVRGGPSNLGVPPVAAEAIDRLGPGTTDAGGVTSRACDSPSARQGLQVAGSASAGRSVPPAMMSSSAPTTASYTVSPRGGGVGGAVTVRTQALLRGVGGEAAKSSGGGGPGRMAATAIFGGARTESSKAGYSGTASSTSRHEKTVPRLLDLNLDLVQPLGPGASFTSGARRVGSILSFFQLPELRQLRQASADWVFNLTGQAGSCMYMAPEVYCKLPYNEKADVFSFAVVMYELLSRDLLIISLFNTSKGARLGLKKPDDYAAKVCQGFRPPRPACVSDGAWSLICDCWQDDPVQRPAMEEVLQRLQALRDEEAARPTDPRGLWACAPGCSVM